MSHVDDDLGYLLCEAGVLNESDYGEIRSTSNIPVSPAPVRDRETQEWFNNAHRHALNSNKVGKKPRKNRNPR